MKKTKRGPFYETSCTLLCTYTVSRCLSWLWLRARDVNQWFCAVHLIVIIVVVGDLTRLIDRVLICLRSHACKRHDVRRLVIQLGDLMAPENSQESIHPTLRNAYGIKH